jgi:hypothetical protein
MFAAAFSKTVRSNLRRRLYSSLEHSDPKKSFKIDTTPYIDALKHKGFSEEQARTAVNCFEQVIEESVSNLEANLVSKEELDLHSKQQQSDFDRIKAELHLLERNDITILKQGTEKVVAELDKLKLKNKDDLMKLQSGATLDLNLEKGRLKEEQSILEKHLADMEARLKQQVQETKYDIKQTRWNTIKLITGTISSVGVLILLFAKMR